MTIITRRMLGTGAASLLVAASSTRLALADVAVVRIGYTGPLSGGAALYGKNCLSGLQMAAAEINAAGGLAVAGKTITFEVVPLDDRYNPSEAALNAKRLVEQNQAPVVFTSHSGGAFAIQAFNQQSNLLLAAYTSIPALTTRGNALTLRIPPAFDSYIKPFAAYEIKRFGKKLGMAGGDHEYAKAWARLFGPAWEAAGGTIVAANPMSYNRDADFYSGVSKVLASQPDVLFIGGASEPTALVAKQARELGFAGGFAIMDQAKLDEMSKITGGLEPLEGAIGVLPLAYDGSAPVKDFVKRYRANHANDPNTEASLNYTAFHVVAGAMAKAGTTADAKAIRAEVDAATKALTPRTNPNGVTGVEIDGGFTSNAIAAAVDKGKITQLRLADLL